MVPKILSKLCDRDLGNSLPRSGTFHEASEQLDSHQVQKVEVFKIKTRNKNFVDDKL